MNSDLVPEPFGGHVTHADRTVALVRAMILDGRLAPAERINEVHLANALGISRGPLREALRRLSSEGLIQIVPHRGAFVSSFTPRQLRELYELRVALECHAARLIAEMDDRSSVELLAAEVENAARHLHADGAAYPADQDFHGTLLQLADSGELYEAAMSVSARIRLARSRSAGQPSRARAALREHRDILDALVRGDADAATRLLRSHLSTSLENAIGLLASQSGL